VRYGLAQVIVGDHVLTLTGRPGTDLGSPGAGLEVLVGDRVRELLGFSPHSSLPPQPGPVHGEGDFGSIKNVPGFHRAKIGEETNSVLVHLFAQNKAHIRG
jgi:hypothetical protein